ncbi:hypothetical protein AH786_23660 [Salmonella enterica subsp. enterica]|nr:hypothetical protein [Salmonella enterica subsp. enterica]
MATFRNCSIFSIHHLMTFFVILNKKHHVASKKSYCFDFALGQARWARQEHQHSHCAFQHGRRLSFRHKKLYPVPCRNIECKHLRVDLR